MVLACEKCIIPMAFQVLNLFVCGDGQQTWLYLVKQVGYTTVTSQIQMSRKQLLRNSSDSCSEIKRLCHYGDVIVFTDIVDRKVKTFDPRATNVETLEKKELMMKLVKPAPLSKSTVYAVCRILSLCRA